MAHCENDGFDQQIWYALKEEKISILVATVSPHTIESTKSYLGEKIRKPGPQNIFCGLQWVQWFQPGGGARNLPLSPAACPAKKKPGW